ncbi:MAG: lysophospholipid acyltransferase family protein [Planctomycetes bacterium]|nr:lysophospholipid acyltransferase family protein [Planctomycetota bacterium]
MKRSGPQAWIFCQAVRLAFAILQIFPIDWNLRTARVLARLWILIMPRHRDRAIQHLAASYGHTLTPDEITRLADRSLEGVVMFAVEVMCLPRLITRSTWTRYVTAVNFQELLRLVIEGRGLIMVTGHFGSFELIGHVLACFKFPMAAVMRPLDNAYLNRFLVSTRKRNGLALFDKKGVIANAESFIENGGLLGFIGDQDAGRKGLFVEFFGRPASTYKSIGLLAMRLKRPIVVGFARRRGPRAQYEVGVQRIIRPEEWETKDDPLRWVTQEYTSAIEAMVRRNPEQYLWIHRRWKSRPKSKTGAPGELGPATSPHQTEAAIGSPNRTG